MYENLKNILKTQYNNRIATELNKVSSLSNEKDISDFMRWSLNKRTAYSGDINHQKVKICNAIQNKINKQLNEELKFIESVEQSKDFNGELIVTVEWKKSHMWGMNPRSYNNYGFVGSSVGGCGYDKLSTATAEALNNHLPLLKMLWSKKELLVKINNGLDLIETEKRNLIGYGSGYNVFPKFEGGVGVDCHLRICENLGLKARCVTNTNNTNVYLISKE